MSLIISETAFSQNFVRNKKGSIVGVITEKGDTLHALPIAESRIIHEAAVKKLVLAREVQVMDSLIGNLEFRLWSMERRYEDLMTNSGSTAIQLRKEIQLTKDERDDLKIELRQLKRKLFWANVRTGAVAVLGGVIVWLVGK